MLGKKVRVIIPHLNVDIIGEVIDVDGDIVRVKEIGSPMYVQTTLGNVHECTS